MTGPAAWPLGLGHSLGADRLVLDEAGRGRYAQDYAAIETRAPTAVLRSSDESECAAAIAFAAEAGIDVAIRGAGLSCNGQTLSKDLVIAFAPPTTPIPPASSAGVIELHGGQRWIDVAQALVGSGWMMPVMTASLFASVAGTLSNSGFGARSIRHGCQVDHLRKFRLITPDGAVAEVGPDDPLFGVAPGAQGQAGLITSATVSLVPAAATSHALRRPWPDLRSMLSELEVLAGADASARPDSFFVFLDRAQLCVGPMYGVMGWDAPSGQESGRPPVTEGAAYETRHFDLDLHRDVEAWVRGFDDSRFLLADFVFDFDGFSSFVTEILGSEIPPFLTAAYILASTPPPPGKPRFVFDPRVTTSDLNFGLGVYCVLTRSEPLDAAQAFLARAAEACLSLGGRPLMYGASAYAGPPEALGYSDAMQQLSSCPGARRGFNRAWSNRGR